MSTPKIENTNSQMPVFPAMQTTEANALTKTAALPADVFGPYDSYQTSPFVPPYMWRANTGVNQPTMGLNTIECVEDNYDPMADMTGGTKPRCSTIQKLFFPEPTITTRTITSTVVSTDYFKIVCDLSFAVDEADGDAELTQMNCSMQVPASNLWLLSGLAATPIVLDGDCATQATPFMPTDQGW